MGGPTFLTSADLNEQVVHEFWNKVTAEFDMDAISSEQVSVVILCICVGEGVVQRHIEKLDNTLPTIPFLSFVLPINHSNTDDFIIEENHGGRSRAQIFRF